MKSKWAKPAKLASLLKKHRREDEAEIVGFPETADASDPVIQFIYSWLLWEASSEHANPALEKLLEAHVDFNELRVSLPHEMANIVGKRYPRAEERFTRLKKSLHGIYLKHHSVTLEHLASQNKRDAKAYLEGLDGMHGFVANRMLRVCCGVHAISADEQLAWLLHEHGVIDEPVESEPLANWLTSTIKAAQGGASSATLQAVIDVAWEDGTMTKINRRRRTEREAEEKAKRKAEAEAEAKAAAEAAAKLRIQEEKKAAVKKAAAKKAAAIKKAAAKKADAAKKAAAKKADAAKKAAAKKADAAKKAAAKKAAAKKAASKKTAKKKTTKKKAPAKKAASKKTARKTTKKKAATKKPAKKAPAKKAASKKTVRKKAATRKKPSRARRK
ncbi:MAG: hypothetical protein MK085_05735 [Phycisphaerales bacterium]|nr:hypothetical protein [Phycisphaerales bacterium]